MHRKFDGPALNFVGIVLWFFFSKIILGGTCEISL